MAKINKNISKKRFYNKDRYIKYNWEKSPESIEGAEKVRYHFIIVNDRFRESKLDKLISNFHEKSIMNYVFEEVRRIEGKVFGTDYRYLFVSYDTIYTPQFLNFSGISKNVKRDFDLRERKKGTSEDYVSSLYSE